MKILFVYLVIINLLSLFLMAEDKRRARRHLWRIPERTLFAAALVGGSVGVWKTRRKRKSDKVQP